MRIFTSQILREMATQRRRVLSDWRIHVIARRLAHAENAQLPDERRSAAFRDELRRRGDIVGVDGVAGVNIVDVPYAHLLDVSEEQIIQEANPGAVFGFLTAMTLHGLTDLAAREVYAIATKGGKTAGRLPLGTTPEDWADGASSPSPRRPKRVRDVVVNWTQPADEPGFGVTVGYSLGVPIYVTDLERTLLDALNSPDKAGGIAKVLEMWRAADGVDLGTLVSYADKYDNQVLRQRVGFLLSKLGRPHPRLDEWKRDLQRGGSMKLVAGDPYSEVYSAEWNLSLNVPPSVLAILDEE